MGVSRVIEIDTTGGPQFGLQHLKGHDLLRDREVVLTFDDGPHARYTDRIVEVLKKYQVKSVFFELGTNLGTLKHNKIQATRAASAARHVVEAGFTVGSHGLSHSLLPKQIHRSQKL